MNTQKSSNQNGQKSLNPFKKGYKRIFRSFVAFMALAILSMTLNVSYADHSGTTDWPDPDTGSNESSWTIIIDSNGDIITDEEAEGSCDDTTNGGASVNPSSIDVASSADCGSPDVNPGDQYSGAFFFDDGGTEFTGECTNNNTSLQDDVIYFRMRLADEPRKK